MNISNGYVNGLSASYTRASTGGSSAGSPYFKSWETKYTNLKFYVGESSFGKKGIGSMTISKEQLREIEASADKRAEFEKMLKDCNKVAGEMKNRSDKRLEAQGFVYKNAGELRAWISAKTYTGTPVRNTIILDNEKPSSWFGSMSFYIYASSPDDLK